MKTMQVERKDGFPSSREQADEALGLCVNCANLSDCNVWRSSRGAIIECEMYECCLLPRPELVGSKKKAVSENTGTETIHILGLCANCEHRRDCKLPKPSSGVWHCEMYD